MFRLCRPDDFGVRERTLIPRVMAEFLGTFMLVLTVGLNVMAASPAAAFSIAASLTCMVYALGDVSGAHFNPAVTAAIFATRKCEDLTLLKAGKYILAQLCGGMLAAFTYSSIYHGVSFPLAPSTNFSLVSVILAEMLFTFLLCYVVLCVAVPDTTRAPTMYGLAIGSCVMVGGSSIGTISGGAMNPAISIGVSAIHLLSGGGFKAAIVYTLSELAGGILAAGVFAFTHRDPKGKDK